MRTKRNKKIKQKHTKRKHHKSHKYIKKEKNKPNQPVFQEEDMTSNIKPFVSLNCSPKKKNEVKEYTCYTDDDLHKLRNVWNARHPDKPITTNDSKEIWNMLKNYYANICNKESCWIRQMVKGTKMEDELLDSFSPVSPITWKKKS